ncbi:MAG: 7-cyano-7-deazaguanine synthase QueC [Gammaproteobacteria bacterium]|nr:7-cyano-7-deazaguanine synthase QueC [Gammaproteobacteria bacterium]MDP2139304.1 7-cyano-7-deazaguanine synthase QueC [Gammaproteobacteria bacterium]MDP2346861.1 7-cyano-7-deazaguanine synthase QueC [Gammaproteobacteria bacterium]
MTEKYDDSSVKRAVVLISGGLDSTTCLAIAKAHGYAIYALSFDYGQRSVSELQAARIISANMDVAQHLVISLGIGALGGSALTDNTVAVPVEESEGIPVTYVPARNTVFLSYALALAEVVEASSIYIGVNARDYSGYPDCRPEFIDAFEKMANLATRAAVEGSPVKIETPLLTLSKAEIITLGSSLGVDYSRTVSCYQADEQGRACGCCDSCRFRRKGFLEAGLQDPTRYA